ncbi:hypothetical protein NW765_009520 [Fusarium oxysporum]|nr:hypothetical protein NW765_009520 [Fusarium oxysporum]
MFGAGVGTKVNADGQPATARLAAGELLVERIASLAFEPDGESEALDDEHSYKLDGQSNHRHHCPSRVWAWTPLYKEDSRGQG